MDRVRARFLADLGGVELIEAVHAHPHFPPHAHPTYAVGVVEWGVNRFRYRGAWHAATAGTLCTVTPDEVHTVEAAGAAGFAYRCLYPPSDLVREAAEAVQGRPPAGTLLLPPVIDDPTAARELAQLVDLLDRAASPLLTQALLGELLTRLVVRHAASPVRECLRKVPEKALGRARDLLSARLAENVSLLEAAAEAGMGRFAFLRAFSRAYGLTPHAWVIQERVRRAQLLLRAGRMPAEVAAEVGFTDQSHLTRHFKRLVGVTPGCYRAPRGWRRC